MQMKGRNNKKPNAEYHTYIVALILNKNNDYKIESFDLEYNNGGDFNIGDLNTELLTKVVKAKPELLTQCDDEEQIIIALRTGATTQENLLKSFKEKGISLKLLLKMISNPEIDKVFDTSKIDFESDVDKSDNNECTMLKLYDAGIINSKRLTEYCDHLIWYNDKMYFYVDEWSDLDNILDSYVIKVLDGDIYEDWDTYYEIDTVNYVWDKLNDENKKNIKKVSLGIEITIDEEEIILSDENLVFKEPDSTRWNRTPNVDLCIVASGKTHRYEDILDELKHGALQEIFEVFSNASNECDTNAQIDEVYKYAKGEVTDLFGNFKQVKHGSKKGKDGNEYDNYIWIFDSPENIFNVVNENVTNNDIFNGYGEESIYYCFCEQTDKISLPDRDWYGTVSDESFNCVFYDRLYNEFSDKLKD